MENGVYCPRCGLMHKNSGAQGACKLCEGNLDAGQTPRKKTGEYTYSVQTPYKTFSQFAQRAVISRKSGAGGLVARLLSLPAFIRYRFADAPPLTPVFSSRKPRFTVTKISDQAIPAGMEWLKDVTEDLGRHGFIAVLDRVNESVAPSRHERILASKDKKIYAVAWRPHGSSKPVMEMVYIPETGAPLHVSNEETPLPIPPGFVYFPAGKPEKILAETEKKIARSKVRSKKMSVKNIALELANAHRKKFDNAKKKGLLKRLAKDEIKARGETDICANHRGAPAVMVCAQCGKRLCDTCGIKSAGVIYCSACLPKGAVIDKGPSVDLSGEMRPAGIFVRGMVGIVEVCALLWLAVWMFPGASSSGSMIAYQFLAAGGFILYFFLFTAIRGATPLQRMAGLAVIDADGEPLSVSSAFIRTGYLLLTIMTIIPAIGYIATLIDPYRRSWADRMSGALVVTSGGAWKNMAGAGLLCAAAAYVSLNFSVIKPVIISKLSNSLPSVSSGNVSASPAWLAPVWEKGAVSAASPLILKDRGVVVTAGKESVTALNMKDGTVAWTAPVKGVTAIYADPYTSLCMAYGNAPGEGSGITAISRRDGMIAWRVPLGGAGRFAPAFTKDMMFIVDAGKLTAIDKLGAGKWEADLGAVSAPEVAGHGVLVSVDSIDGSGAVLLDTRTGAQLAFFDNRRPAAPTQVSPGDNQRYLFAGDDDTVSLTDVGSGKEIWSVEGTLTFLDNSAPSGPVYYAVERPVNKSDGDAPYQYPENCRYTGNANNLAILTCAGSEKNIRVIHRITGQVSGAFKGVVFDKTRLVYQQGTIYQVLWTRQTPEGRVSAGFVIVDLSHRRLTSMKLGEFDNAPVVKYLPDTKSVFVGTERFVGVYRLPDKKGVRSP